MIKLLVFYWFSKQNFWKPELISLCTIFGIKLKIISEINEKVKLPYIWIEIDSIENVKLLCQRSVFIRGFYKIWISENTFETFFKSLLLIPSETLDSFVQPETTFKIQIDSFGSRKELKRSELIEKISSLPFKGVVNLSNPKCCIQYLEIYYYEPNSTRSLNQIFLGEVVCEGTGRKLIDQYKLTKRKYIGTTSMSSELSIISATQGLVSANKLIYDPFVGTGSLLLLSVHFGAYVMGSDIDSSSFLGNNLTSPHSLMDSFQQYLFDEKLLCVFVEDISHPSIEIRPIFDAIICDPPYGIREVARTLGLKTKSLKTKKNFEKITTNSYSLSKILNDLIEFSASRLVMDGRLVYWLPTFRPNYSDHKVPTHSSLELVANSEDVLTTKWSRRLITMRKIREYVKNRDDLSEELALYYNSFRSNVFTS